MSKKRQVKSTFNGFKQASTTPVPDDLFDELLSILTGSELKVLLYIIRRTKGFNKDSDAISLSQFQHGIIKKGGEQLDRGCGISDRQTIVDALASLETKKCISSEKNKTASGDNAVSIYRVLCNTRVVGKTNQGTQEKPTTLVGKTNRGGRKNPERVVGKTNPQETVIQQTDSQETVIQQDITDENSANSNIVPNGTSPSLSSQDQIALLTAQVTQLTNQLAQLASQLTGDTNVSNLTPPPADTRSDSPNAAGIHNHRTAISDHSSQNNQAPSADMGEIEQKSVQLDTQVRIADLTTGKTSDNENVQQITLFDGEAKASKPPSKKRAAQIPSADAAWNEETAVQIIEAIKGRRYSDTTRQKEKNDAKKILGMWYDDHKITRDEFEKAVDNMMTWDCWGKTNVKPMIKHLLKDDRIIDIIDGIKAKANKTKSSTQKVVHIKDRQPAARVLSSYDDPSYVDDTFYSDPLPTTPLAAIGAN